MNSNKLFYLTGFQRSGTTLCCQLLDKHPEILCADEPEFVKRIFYNQQEKLNDPKNDSIMKNLEFYNVEFKDYLKIVKQFTDGDISNHNFLTSCYSLMNTKNAPLIGAKEVIDIVSDNFNFIDSLIATHPSETKYIFIERDIKGVIASFIKMGFFPPGKRRINNFNLAKFAKKYRKIIKHAKSVMPQEKTLYITFEKLLTQPEKMMKKIYTFLDVNSKPELISEILTTPRNGVRNRYSAINENIKDNWKQILTEKQIKMLDNQKGVR
jgi:hypothetical protein